MISDVLARLAILHKEIPEEEFDVDTAVRTAAEDVDRELTDEDWETLDELLPEWLEDGDDAAQKELVTDGGTQQTGDQQEYLVSVFVQKEIDERVEASSPEEAKEKAEEFVLDEHWGAELLSSQVRSP